jgi:alanine dehydrogenase
MRIFPYYNSARFISPIHLSILKAELLQKMMDKRITAISFENLRDDSGTYPIVHSMSEMPEAP